MDNQEREAAQAAVEKLEGLEGALHEEASREDIRLELVKLIAELPYFAPEQKMQLQEYVSSLPLENLDEAIMGIGLGLKSRMEKDAEAFALHEESQARSQGPLSAGEQERLHAETRKFKAAVKKEGDVLESALNEVLEKKGESWDAFREGFLARNPKATLAVKPKDKRAQREVMEKLPAIEDMLRDTFAGNLAEYEVVIKLNGPLVKVRKGAIEINIADGLPDEIGLELLAKLPKEEPRPAPKTPEAPKEPPKTYEERKDMLQTAYPRLNFEAVLDFYKGDERTKRLERLEKILPELARELDARKVDLSSIDEVVLSVAPPFDPLIIDQHKIKTAFYGEAIEKTAGEIERMYAKLMEIRRAPNVMRHYEAEGWGYEYADEKEPPREIKASDEPPVLHAAKKVALLAKGVEQQLGRAPLEEAGIAVVVTEFPEKRSIGWHREEHLLFLDASEPIESLIKKVVEVVEPVLVEQQLESLRYRYPNLETDPPNAGSGELAASRVSLKMLRDLEATMAGVAHELGEDRFAEMVKFVLDFRTSGAPGGSRKRLRVTERLEDLKATHPGELIPLIARAAEAKSEWIESLRGRFPNASFKLPALETLDPEKRAALNAAIEEKLEALQGAVRNFRDIHVTFEEGGAVSILGGELHVGWEGEPHDVAEKLEFARKALAEFEEVKNGIGRIERQYPNARIKISLEGEISPRMTPPRILFQKGKELLAALAAGGIPDFEGLRLVLREEGEDVSYDNGQLFLNLRRIVTPQRSKQVIAEYLKKHEDERKKQEQKDQNATDEKRFEKAAEYLAIVEKALHKGLRGYYLRAFLGENHTPAAWEFVHEWEKEIDALGHYGDDDWAYLRAKIDEAYRAKIKRRVILDAQEGEKLDEEAGITLGNVILKYLHARFEYKKTADVLIRKGILVPEASGSSEAPPTAPPSSKRPVMRINLLKDDREKGSSPLAVRQTVPRAPVAFPAASTEAFSDSSEAVPTGRRTPPPPSTATPEQHEGTPLPEDQPIDWKILPLARKMEQVQSENVHTTLEFEDLIGRLPREDAQKAIKLKDDLLFKANSDEERERFVQGSQLPQAVTEVVRKDVAAQEKREAFESEGARVVAEEEGERLRARGVGLDERLGLLQKFESQVRLEMAKSYYAAKDAALAERLRSRETTFEPGEILGASAWETLPAAGELVAAREAYARMNAGLQYALEKLEDEQRRRMSKNPHTGPKEEQRRYLSQIGIPRELIELLIDDPSIADRYNAAKKKLYEAVEKAVDKLPSGEEERADLLSRMREDMDLEGPEEWMREERVEQRIRAEEGWQ